MVYLCLLLGAFEGVGMYKCYLLVRNWQCGLSVTSGFGVEATGHLLPRLLLPVWWLDKIGSYDRIGLAGIN